MHLCNSYWSPKIDNAKSTVNRDAPGPVVRNSAELAAAVRSIEGRQEEAREKAAAFRQKFMYSCDGHATERIWQEIVKQAEE